MGFHKRLWRSGALAHGKTLVALTAGVGMMAGALPVLAESADAPAAEAASDGLGEIVVTARRRDESLERVPLSESVLTPQALVERQVFTQQDLQNSVAGLIVAGTASTSQFTYAIRGQAIDAFSGSQPGVLSYVNEFQATAVTQGAFYDLGSIQVLKGPQGTLFGRNTTGGAVLFETTTPTDQLGGYLTTRVGNYNHREFEGAFNLPINDVVQVRFAGVARKHDGYVENLLNGRDLNDENFKSGRVTLMVKPSETISNETMVQYDSSGNNGSALILYSLYPCSPNSPPAGLYVSCLYGPANPGFAAYRAAHPNVPAGGIEESYAIQQGLGPWALYDEAPTLNNAITRLISNKTNIKLNDDLTFKNVIGYASSYNLDMYDQDGTPATYYKSIGLTTDIKQWSIEPQIQGIAFDGKLNWIAGGYYSQEHEGHVDEFDALDLSPVSGPFQVTYNFVNKSRTEGIFSQGTYDLSSLTHVQGLSFTGGVRYTWEHIDLDILQNPSLAAGTTTVLSRDDHKPSWTVGLEWQLNEQLLAYITSRGSWRSGGFNGHVPPTNEAAFAPETTRDVELGLKYSARPGGIPVRANVALYNQWVKDTQRLVDFLLNGTQAAFTLNAPDGSETAGMDLDVEVEPIPSVNLGLNYAYMNAKYSGSSSLTIFGQDVLLGPYADAPRSNASLYGKWTLPLPSSIGKVSLRLDASYRSAMYFSNTDNVDPGSRLGSYTLLNGRLEWANVQQTPLSVAAYIKNAAKREYYTGGLGIGPQSGDQLAIPGNPRVYGLELNYKF